MEIASSFQFVILLTFIAIQQADAKDVPECSESKSLCRYTLVVEEQLTMMWGNIHLDSTNGSLYRHEEAPGNITEEIPMDEVISVDGVKTPRVVVAVNNSIPGPALIVFVGQTLRIRVANHLVTDSISVHWHGVHQRGTPYMDGVAYITQCPITAGQSFVYEFKAATSGTYWYHSHIGGQRMDGLFGALIIKERTKPETQQTDRSRAIDMIMHVNEWFHYPSIHVYWKLKRAYLKLHIEDFLQPKTLDGIYFAPIPFVSALIEGRSRYMDPKSGKWTESPLKIYTVKKGEVYRFRVIAAGTIFPFRVSVDGHPLTIIATDGFDVEDKVVESVILNPGERYDFLLFANQSIDNYWIRAETIEHNVTFHMASAIVRYEGAIEKEPRTNRMNCTKDDMCIVLNCPYAFYPEDHNTKCLIADELESLVGTAPPFESDSEEYFMNWANDPHGTNVNGRHFLHPGVNVLGQHSQLGKLPCEKHDCGDDKICFCYNEITLPFNKTVDMVWTNHGAGATRLHPIHLHGHSFHVLKMGYPEFDPVSGLMKDFNKDITCGHNTSLNFCNHPRWSNKSWTKGRAEGLKLKNAPVKDTLVVPVGGYAVVRIRTDNPGVWLVHCHVEMHSLQGMAIVLREAPEHQPKRPFGFPVCQDFNNDGHDAHFEEVVGGESKPTPTDKIIDLVPVVCALGVILCIQTFALSYICWKRKKRTELNKTVVELSEIIANDTTGQ